MLGFSGKKFSRSFFYRIGDLRTVTISKKREGKVNTRTFEGFNIVWCWLWNEARVEYTIAWHSHRPSLLSSSLDERKAPDTFPCRPWMRNCDPPPLLPATLFSIPRFLSDLFMWLPTVDVKQCSNRPLQRCKRGSTRIRCWEFFYSPMGKPILYVSCWKYSNSTAESPPDLNWCLEYLLWLFFVGYENRFDGYSWEKLGEGTMPWAIWFFFKWEENKYFSDLFNPNFVEKIYILFYTVYSHFILFFDEQSEFLDVRFYWNKLKWLMI